MPNVDITTGLTEKATPAGTDDLLGIDRAENTVKTFQIDTLPIAQSQVTGLGAALDAKATAADVTALDGRVDALEAEPPAHASRHQHGGSDEIATATPAPNAIPKASSGGWLDGWLSSAIARLADLTWGNISGKPTTFPPADHEHDAADITTGTFAAARLGSGAAGDGSKVLLDNQTWGDAPSGGVTDHGALTGLGDDDHLQYALADGTRGAFEAAGAVNTHNADTGAHGQTAAGRALLTAADAAAQRAALDVYSKAESDALGGGGSPAISNATGLLYAGYLM